MRIGVIARFNGISCSVGIEVGKFAFGRFSPTGITVEDTEHKAAHVERCEQCSDETNHVEDRALMQGIGENVVL